jgi:hypothetical protein
MSEHAPRDSTQESEVTETEPHVGMAARIGERILKIGGFFSRSPASLLSREEAVWQGFGSVVGRVLAGAGILFLCWLLGSLYGAGSVLLRRAAGLKRDDGFDGAILFIMALIAMGIFAIGFWNDWERKWRVLSWVCFVLVAAWTLMWRSNTVLQLMILAGQFGIHWFIHEALKARDRQEEWEQEIEAARRREARTTNRQLQMKYRGHSGFSEKPADTATPDIQPD